MNGSGGDNADKNSTGVLWGVGLILAIIWVIWYNFKLQIISGYIAIKYYELIFLEYFSELTFLPIENQIIEMLNYIDYTYNPYDPNLNVVYTIAKHTGFYINFFFAAMAMGITYYLWQKNSVTKFVKKHSMDSLSQQEQHNWTLISPVIGKNLVKTDLNKGPWAVADTPLQFCKKHKLLTVETVADRKNPWKLEGVKKATLLRKEAFAVLKKQLGPLWEGEHYLAPHRKALFAVFLARIENNKKAADDLLEDLSVSFTKGGLDYSGVTPILTKHFSSKAVQKCIQRHAYVMSVLAALLELARTSGVLATSSFLWLKLVDRELWYMLNSVGRQTPYSEVAAPWAHFIAEKEMGRALFKPVIEESLNALEESLGKVIYTDDEEKG